MDDDDWSYKLVAPSEIKHLTLNAVVIIGSHRVLVRLVEFGVVFCADSEEAAWERCKGWVEKTVAKARRPADLPFKKVIPKIMAYWAMGTDGGQEALVAGTVPVLLKRTRCSVHPRGRIRQDARPLATCG